jgi:hypothetical protein
MKKLFIRVGVILGIFIICIGLLFYSPFGYKKSVKECEEILAQAYKKATETLQKEDFDSTVIKNLYSYQVFGEFILKNKGKIEKYNKNNSGYAGRSLSYFPENLRNEAEKLWKKCNIKTLSIVIYGKEVRFRINGYGKRVYYSTIYHDIIVSKKPVEYFPEKNRKIYSFENNVIYQIFFGIEAIDGCDN